MDAYKTIYRSCGLPEWRLIRQDGRGKFPACMIRADIFYPSLLFENACGLAREFNTRDPASEFAGLVLACDVPPDFLREYDDPELEPEALWLPPETRAAINDALQGPLRVCEVIYGAEYSGPRFTALELSDPALLL